MEAVVKDIQGVQRHQECVWKGLRGEDCTFMTRCTVVLIFPPWYNNCFASDEKPMLAEWLLRTCQQFCLCFFCCLSIPVSRPPYQNHEALPIVACLLLHLGCPIQCEKSRCTCILWCSERHVTWCCIDMFYGTLCWCVCYVLMHTVFKFKGLSPLRHTVLRKCPCVIQLSVL